METNINLKERIAAFIFDHDWNESEARPSEETCHAIAEEFLRATPAVNAAPELLEALEDVLSEACDFARAQNDQVWMDEYEWHNKAQAIIAKAKGEE